MAPGNSTCKEVVATCSIPDFKTTLSKVENLSISTKAIANTGLNVKHGTSSSKGVHELLECPVCTNLMYPPISQCPNGHTLCSNCRTKVHNSCPTCRYKLGSIRCLALEKVAESLELPCRYQNRGFHDIFPFYSKVKHEHYCKSRPYNCPYAGSGCAIMSLVEHLKDDHRVDMHDGSTFNHCYVKPDPQEVENATWMLTVFNCYGKQFCLHFEAFQLGAAPVYMAFVRFMGEEDEAKTFSYSLEVLKTAHIRLRLILQDLLVLCVSKRSQHKIKTCMSRRKHDIHGI